MATQGVLSIVDEDGDVVIKVVTGSDGARIPALANEISNWTKEEKGAIDEVYYAARRVVDSNSIIVMNQHGSILQSPSDFSDVGPLPDLYYKKFNDPRFNPRWDHGTAEYVEIIQLTTK